MSKPSAQSPPPDQQARKEALDPSRSILVQAPAGSGKTDLLTRRFLRLLAVVDDPEQIAAITFTNAAAAEMRNRVLATLEGAAAVKGTGFSPYIDPAIDDGALAPEGDSSINILAHRALERSRLLGWNLLDLPAQLRIRTIDSFCRELALQQPLLSGLGGSLQIAEQPDELYRRAARETLKKIDQAGSAISAAIEELLLWRDNNWQEMEVLLVAMLKSRDRWMHGFLLEREPDWEALRERLERPFAHAVTAALDESSQLLDQAPNARNEALALARFACEQSGGQLYQELAELVEFPVAPFTVIEESRQAHANLANLLLTADGGFRKQVDKRLGFSADRKREKNRLLELIAALDAIPGLEAALAAVRALPPARYTEEDWRIVRSCFVLLRHAAGELQIAFAEAGRVDYTEVAQIAQRVLRGEDGHPTDAALVVSDKIRHLLVDEFQDTSRRQHQLLSSLIAAWPERPGRTCFVVGDPMQSIYSFREADAELFLRVKAVGLEIPHDEPQLFDFLPLTSNFRTAPSLVERINRDFANIFAEDDGSGIRFSPSQPAREEAAGSAAPFTLHLNFVPQTTRGQSGNSEVDTEREEQIDEIVALIRGQMKRVEQARADKEHFRIAVLGRTRAHLAPIAAALRTAQIPFRAVELEELATRTEVRDALALARALFNSQDRVAWLGVLRAPWCGLSLADLHKLATSDDPESHPRPIPELLTERLPQLSEFGRVAAKRVLDAVDAAAVLRAAQPAISLGSRLEQLWLQLGGAACVDSTARANLNLLWSCLDGLSGGEEELLGPVLDAALKQLTALPDSGASSDCGVQLMTIHKSKGLEFEVVIVPELQARTRSSSQKMLSWMERGLSQPETSGEITEFLIAPFQRKGVDRGSAKAWVDRVCRERETQEMRRILYVASTRAREELHLFARPAYKTEADGALTLVEPANSLLATAWPALEVEVSARFDEWKAAHAVPESHEEQIESIAASGESNLLVLPKPIRLTPLRRLPLDYKPALVDAIPRASAEGMGIHDSQPIWEKNLYSRHEGGLRSRALGTAVHTLLEELSRLRITLDWEAARQALAGFEPRIAAGIRAVGIERPQSTRIAAEALQLALNASRDPIGSWILSPHRNAVSEASWAGVLSGGLRAVRIDRIFQSGSAPASDKSDCWWLIDYKTAHAENLDSAQALPALRELFAPQLEAYVELLRNLHGTEARLFAGLYYPRISMLDWWEIKS